MTLLHNPWKTILETAFTIKVKWHLDLVISFPLLQITFTVVWSAYKFYRQKLCGFFSTSISYDFYKQKLYPVKPIPPVDLHWFFEISIRTEKKNQLVYTDISFQFSLEFFFSSKLWTEKKFQWELKKKFI